MSALQSSFRYATLGQLINERIHRKQPCVFVWLIAAPVPVAEEINNEVRRAT